MPRLFALALAALLGGTAAFAQNPSEPYVGQPGKDVVWVPTPHTLTEKMLDMAKVTSKDFVMDLGSGDGRNVIAAAKRGARALGVEYEAQLVQISRKNAQAAGVGDKAQFVQADMFEADISQATVFALFLLPDNLRRLKPKFEKLKPGTRIVTNGFEIDGWEAKEIARIDKDCGGWCTAYLYILPAKAKE